MRPAMRFLMVAALALWGLAAPVAADVPEHEHAPRHGGLFGDADDLYHYEVVVDAPNRLRVYVSDDDNQPLDTRPLQGRWELFPGTPEAVSGALTPSADGGFLTATLPEGLPASVPVEIAVQKDHQWAAIEFEISSPPPANR